MEYERDFVDLTLGNLRHARVQGATGCAELVCGDARNIAATFNGLHGRAALVLTSPPYGSRTHGHIRSNRDNRGGKLLKWHHRYSTDHGNLAHQTLTGLLDGFGRILAGAATLLRPSGVIAVTVRPIRVKGELIDLPGQVIDTAHQHGLVLAGRYAALLAGLRDGALVNRASFFQMLETRRARERGIPACATAHEDLLIFSVPGPDGAAGDADATTTAGTVGPAGAGQRIGLDRRVGAERAYQRSGSTGRSESDPLEENHETRNHATGPGGPDRGRRSAAHRSGGA